MSIMVAAAVPYACTCLVGRALRSNTLSAANKTMSSQEQPLQDSTVPSKQVQDEFIKKLEEEDEFEDFPEDDWQDPQTVSSHKENDLWEESWEDHDDCKDLFTKKLRYVSRFYWDCVSRPLGMQPPY